MFDNVLLPIDLTHPESWEKALPMAVKMCGHTGTLHVLGIVHDLGAAMVASYLPAGFEQEALQKMEFDLETFTSCEVSKRFPQIHFSRSFVDLDSRKGPALYDVVKMSTVMSDGSEQSTVVFNQHDVDDDVIDHEKDEPNP